MRRNASAKFLTLLSTQIDLGRVLIMQFEIKFPLKMENHTTKGVLRAPLPAKIYGLYPCLYSLRQHLTRVIIVFTVKVCPKFDSH